MKLTVKIDLGKNGDTQKAQEALASLALSLAREDTDHEKGDGGPVFVAGVRVGSWAVN